MGIRCVDRRLVTRAERIIAEELKWAHQDRVRTYQIKGLFGKAKLTFLPDVFVDYSQSICDLAKQAGISNACYDCTDPVDFERKDLDAFCAKEYCKGDEKAGYTNANIRDDLRDRDRIFFPHGKWGAKRTLVLVEDRRGIITDSLHQMSSCDIYDFLAFVKRYGKDKLFPRAVVCTDLRSYNPYFERIVWRYDEDLEDDVQDQFMPFIHPQIKKTADGKITAYNLDCDKYDYSANAFIYKLHW